MYFRAIDRQLRNEIGGNLEGETQIHMITLENHQVKEAQWRRKRNDSGGHFREIIGLIIGV